MTGRTHRIRARKCTRIDMVAVSVPLQLQRVPGTFAVVRLPPDAPLQNPKTYGAFYSVTHTHEEISLVCLEDSVPANAQKVELGWSCLRIAGELDFALTGIMARLALPLAEAKISLFAISTFDTDYILIKTEVLERALDVLCTAGFVIEKEG